MIIHGRLFGAARLVCPRAHIDRPASAAHVQAPRPSPTTSLPRTWTCSTLRPTKSITTREFGKHLERGSRALASHPRPQTRPTCGFVLLANTCASSYNNLVHAATGWASAWKAPAPSLHGRMAARAAPTPPTCTTTCMPWVRFAVLACNRKASTWRHAMWHPVASTATAAAAAAKCLSCCVELLPSLQRSLTYVCRLCCHSLLSGALNFTGDMPVVLMVDGPSLGGFVCPVTAATTELWKMGQVRGAGILNSSACALWLQTGRAGRSFSRHAPHSKLPPLQLRQHHACMQVRPGDTVRFRRMTVEEVGCCFCMALWHRQAALPCLANPALPVQANQVAPCTHTV